MSLSGFFDDNCACNRDGSNYCESNDAVVGSYGSFGLGGGIGCTCGISLDFGKPCECSGGINNLYEFDCGQGSGWMYSVNGVFPNYGCSSYKPANNDKIAFRYTCELGYDL